MKKLLILSSLLVALSSQAAVLTTSTNALAAADVAVLPTVLGTGGQIDYVLLSSDASNSGKVKIYDTQYPSMSVTNPAYVSVTRYATNYITSWVNYYGATNSITNIVLQSVLTTNAATTNVLAAAFIFSSPTNTTTEFSGLGYRFNNGIMVTNSGSGILNITVGYIQ